MVFAVTSMGIYGIVLAGWASNSKYSLLGGLRSSAQMLSYELSYGTALAAVIIMGNSLSLREVVDAQSGTWFGVLPGWFVFPQLVGFTIFMIAGVAETNRAPFDFPEAEQELVAGYFTEYSSMSFALFPMAEYVNMVTVAAVATDLYLGGWHYPLPLAFGWVAGVANWFLKVGGDPLLLHLDALDAAAIPLRPAHGLWMEVAAAGLGHQPAADGGRRHLFQLIWNRRFSICSGRWSRRARSPSCSAATRCTACCS